MFLKYNHGIYWIKFSLKGGIKSLDPLIDGIFEVRCACKIANLTTKGNGHKKKKSD